MTFDDAVLVAGLFERKFVSADVVIRSTRLPGPGDRDYAVSVELDAPAPLGEVARLDELNSELEQCDIEYRAELCGREGGVSLVVR
jgi:hypothetical protein